MNITNIPDERLEELFAPLSYKGFLQSMSYFHGYSWRNIFLIYKQMPHATKLAEYDGWKQFGRKVKRGSKTIKILAPIPQEARTKLIEKIDTETGKAILDENGKRVMEEQIIPVPPKFEEKRVLDISQTYGEPVFRFAGDVLANDFLRDASIDALKKVLGGEFETPRNVLSIIRELSQTMETSALTDDWKTLITESVSFVIGKRFGAEEIAA
ncbi:MAG: ssDNA-binding domain-containing protein, partial [Clostridiales bacterium]|nr:ssDNA-binding domain-containing protein [Clostridiales bacterium]